MQIDVLRIRVRACHRSRSWDRGGSRGRQRSGAGFAAGRGLGVRGQVGSRMLAECILMNMAGFCGQPPGVAFQVGAKLAASDYEPGTVDDMLDEVEQPADRSERVIAWLGEVRALVVVIDPSPQLRHCRVIVCDPAEDMQMGPGSAGDDGDIGERFARPAPPRFRQRLDMKREPLRSLDIVERDESAIPGVEFGADKVRENAELEALASIPKAEVKPLGSKERN